MITLHEQPDQHRSAPSSDTAEGESAGKKPFHEVSAACLPSLEGLHRFFEERFRSAIAEENEDIPLLWRPGDARKQAQQKGRPLRSVGFALDHRARLETLTNLDALFLHRPFFLPENTLPGIPIFASHRGFDRCLSIGYNPGLAEALRMTNLVGLHIKGSSLPIGMVGDLKTPLTWYALRALIAQQYEGTEMIGGTVRDPLTQRIALVGAMSSELITQAAEAGARVFVTGQYRPSAQLAIEGNRMMVIAVGHRRAELWGLRRLAAETAAAFPDLQTTMIT